MLKNKLIFWILEVKTQTQKGFSQLKKQTRQKGLRTLFEYVQVAGSATNQQSKTVWNGVLCVAAGVSRTQKQTPRLRKVKRSFIESLCVTIKAGGGSENDSNGVEKDHGGAGGGLEWVNRSSEFRGHWTEVPEARARAASRAHSSWEEEVAKLDSFAKKH